MIATLTCVALVILAATAIVSTAIMWFNSRESKTIAFTTIEFLQERLRAVDKERESWKDEREGLMARVQAWELYKQLPPPAPAKSLTPEQQQAEARKEYTDERLAELNLVRNGDGGVVDAFRRLWESPKDFEDWEVARKQFDLPPDADPRDYQAPPA